MTDRRISMEDYTSEDTQKRLTAAFTIAEQRTVALSKVQSLVGHLQGVLQGRGYYGPVVIGGGYVRDLALGKAPKDLDIFLDSGWIKEKGVSIKALAEGLLGGTVKQVIPCYGDWASDIEMVAKVQMIPFLGLTGVGNEGPDLVESFTVPRPQEIDIVVLRREALLAQGYLSDPTANDGGYLVDCQFLNAVLSRVDLRLNAIGASPLVSQHHPQWDYDALNHRLVVQHERRTLDGTEDVRIEKRLARLGGPEGKFAGWTPLYENAEGGLEAAPQ